MVITRKIETEDNVDFKLTYGTLENDILLTMKEYYIGGKQQVINTYLSRAGAYNLIRELINALEADE